MIRVAIIVTSPFSKAYRIIGGDEWSAWGFKDCNNFAYRLSNQSEVQCCDSIKCIPIPQQGERIIIWINTQKITLKNLYGFLTRLLNYLTEKNVNLNEIWVAYHDVQIDEIPKQLKSQAKLYSLAPANRGQFQAIIKKDNSGKEYFDTLSDFEQIIDCFFFNWPKLTAILKHRIAQILGPIDLDLQRLEEIARANDYTTFYKELKDFRERYKDFDWKGAFNGIESEVDEFLKSQKKELKNYQNLKELLGKNRPLKFLDMVKNENVEKVFEEINNRVSINPLSSWLRELDEKLDETIEGG